MSADVMLTLPQAVQQAVAAYNAGDLTKTERLCRSILDAQADNFEALNLLGVVAARTLREEEAADLLRRAVAARPADAAAHSNYGNVLMSLRRFEEALNSFTRALTLTPDYAEGWCNRAFTLQELGRFAEALDGYGRALQLKPDLVEAHNNRGYCLHQLGRFEEALDSYGLALQFRPGFVEAHNNRGNTLQELRRMEEALACYERVLQLRPGYAEAYNNQGTTLRELRRFEAALASYGRALEVRPEYPGAYYNRGNTLRGLKRFEEALDDYGRALEISPDFDWLYGTWLHVKMHLCDWSGLESHITDLAARIERGMKAAAPFPVLAAIDSLSLQRQAAQIWAAEVCPPSRALPPPARRPRGERLRIGYYSADFHGHATGHLIAGLFESHAKDRFELFAFSYGPDERDEMRERLAAPFTQFLDVRMKSDIEVARLSRELEIDIAVDLKGFTQDARTGIFTSRAAPIQVSYLGYPGTSAAPYIDYLIADETLIPPESRPHYSEKIVYLPHSYQVNDRKRRIADQEFARAELGLPTAGFVFCCFNQSYKITPEMFAGWMRILREVKDSVLWLLEDNKTAADNLRNEAQARSVDPRRLVFAQRMPLAEHLARHRAADLFIDTYPYNAHTAASDALWTGLPILTRVGESFAARVAASLLNAIGMPELATPTQAQYEAVAIELAGNPARMAQIRDRLLRSRLTTPLFDTELFTRHLESAYGQMYARYLAGLSPEHIRVNP